MLLLRGKYEQVFEVKKLVRLLPQLELPAVFSLKSGQDNMSKQCNYICPYWKYDHTQLHSGMGTQTQTDCAYILLSLEYFLIWSCTKQSDYSCTCYIDYIAFLQFQTTTKNAVTCTHTHTGHRDTVAGDKSRQKRICTSAYSARCLKLEVSFRCVLSFAMWNKDS